MPRGARIVRACLDLALAVAAVFFFNDTATPEIYTLSLTTLFRSRMPHVAEEALIVTQR